jgi:muramoyltetrapeptide carboxypeptidase
MLTGSLGTRYEFDSSDSILFIEDYASKPYQIDRMLTQLRDAGKLKAARGLIFGEMTDCQQHPDQGYSIADVIKDRTDDLGIPVLIGLRSGHSDVKNVVLPFGVQATLDCGNTSVMIEEAATVEPDRER